MIDNVNFNTEKVQDMDTIIAKLSVPYNDYEVLTTPSKELELVNYYFESISCNNKEIERLLFEVIGYSLTKTSIFAKSFIFKGNGRNGKSKIFRILEALLGDNQCSHEHLEQISGTKSGSKSSIEAFKEAYNRGKFTIPSMVEEETNKYFMKCNNVVEFCKLCPIKTFVAKTKYYKEYTKWCNSNNVEAVSNNVFGERVLELRYRGERYSFGGKRNNYYVNPDFNNSESRTIYNQYLSQCGISEESITHYTEEELITIFNATPFNDYLCEGLYNKNNIAVSE